jgi:hypothetical protein
VISLLEPNVIIPMFYKHPKLAMKLEGVERFLHELGATPTGDPLASLKLTVSTVPQEPQVILMEPLQE